MGHKHGVRDTNAHFTIDQYTRQIKNDSANRTTIVQYDHNSERLTFEMPLYIDGHAMTLCDLIELHFINISTDGNSENHGTYEVEDIKAEGEKAIFTWLISQEATQLAGSLNFFIVFKCTENGVTVYRWGTEICKTLSISAGMDNGEAVLTEYPDILAQWKYQLFSESETAVLNVTTAEKNALAAIESAGEAKKQSVLDSIPDEYETLFAIAEDFSRTRAGAIVQDAEGESIVLNDASNFPMMGLKLFGKSTQDRTPTPDAPVDIVSVANPTITVDEQTIAIPHTLPGIPVTSGGNYTDADGQQWICDEVDLARGVYVQRIGNKVFDGSDDEIWHFDNLVLDKTIMFRMEIRDSANVGNVVGLDFLCTHFEGKNMYNSDTTGVQHTMQQFYFRLPKTVLTSEDVAGFRTLLAVSPMTVGYVLKTPIETPLSDAEINAFKALHGNKPNTTILNDAGAWMAVEYVADTKTYIDNKIKELTEGVTA